MSQTNGGHIEAVVRSPSAKPTAEHPITWSMTPRALQQNSCEFDSALLAIAGHDLRQPLQIIQSAHELLGLGVRTKSELRLLRSDQSAIDRLTDQLNQLLLALRLRDRANEVELTSVPVEPLLREACSENEDAALKKGIELRMVSTSASIQSDKVLLGTVLRNLVSNAVKYTPPGGRILLGCRNAGHEVRIDVSDTGIGIAVDQMSRIFEAFTRLDSARRGSLGIGLFIVRQAIGILGHRVDITSAPSQGSRFSIFATRSEEVVAQPRQTTNPARNGAA
jgi:two-component system, OmpR family, phosphate regulon sensor histidine kinase PhoR